MKIPYYPGCTLKSTAVNFEVSALEAARALEIDLVEMPRWNCCGTVFSLTTDDLMHHIAPVRNLVRVQEMNESGLVQDEYRLLTLCSMCYNTLSRSNLRVKENPEDLKTINDFMNREKDYEGKVEVIHFLELLKDNGFDRVQKRVKVPLNGLKVFPYYGCMLLRPGEVGIDDPEDPTIQENLIVALGAESVDIPYKKVCCGSYQTVNNKDIVINLAYDILSKARMAGAEIVVTSCPLCAFNLDNRQKEVKENYPGFNEIPVLYFTQLMALAFGLGKEVCKFDLNYIDPMTLLSEKVI